MIAASQVNEESLESNQLGHGYFTYYYGYFTYDLIQALKYGKGETPLRRVCRGGKAGVAERFFSASRHDPQF